MLLKWDTSKIGYSLWDTDAALYLRHEADQQLPEGGRGVGGALEEDGGEVRGQRGEVAPGGTGHVGHVAHLVHPSLKLKCHAELIRYSDFCGKIPVPH